MTPGRQMTIAVLLRHLGEKGGVGVYTRNLLEQMLRIDRENRYVLLFASRDYLKVFGSHPHVTEVLVEGSDSLPGRLAWDQVKVLRELKRHRADIVFNPKLSVPLWASCRTAFPVHGLEQFAAERLFMWHDRLYFRTFMQFYCRKADAVFVTSETGRRDLQKYLGVDPGKIHVVPYSYHENCHVVSDKAELRRVKEKLSLPDRYLFFIGGVVPLKNLPTLFKAYRLLKDKGFPHKLVLAGFKRWKFADDFEVVEKFGLRPDVVDLGFVDTEDLPGIYSQADGFVLPSFYEGFGLPILEAQACGCPVVISSGGAMPEVAGPGGALIFDPGDPAALASCLETCLRKEDVRRKLIEAGLANVKKYSWEKTARGTLAVLTELAQKKASK